MNPRSESTHMPQLDGVRAFAFLMVALSHWIPDDLQFNLPLGTGVQLFFVLSGFLITGILLRNQPRESGSSLAAVLKSFYVRRSLRIFPLYYLVLTVCLVVRVAPIRETWPWHWAYLSNFYFAFHNSAGELNEPFLHLWSLSVEEQFYLVWPLLALTAPRRSLPYVIGGAIVGSLLFRIGVGISSGNTATTRYLTPSCLDALGVGAMVAWAQYERGLEGLRQARNVAAAVGIGGLVLTVPMSALLGSKLSHWIGHTFLIVFYGALVAQAAEGFQGVVGRVLSAKPVRYLGKISYGLYVYHHFAPVALAAIAVGLGMPKATWLEWPYNLLPYFFLTLTTAVISWHGYEVWFLRIKNRFEYSGARKPRGTRLPAKMVTPPAA